MYPTVTSLLGSPNPSRMGSPVVFTAAVTPYGTVPLSIVQQVYVRDGDNNPSDMLTLVNPPTPGGTLLVIHSGFKKSDNVGSPSDPPHGLSYPNDFSLSGFSPLSYYSYSDDWASGAPYYQCVGVWSRVVQPGDGTSWNFLIDHPGGGQNFVLYELAGQPVLTIDTGLCPVSYPSFTTNVISITGQAILMGMFQVNDNTGFSGVTPYPTYNVTNNFSGGTTAGNHYAISFEGNANPLPNSAVTTTNGYIVPAPVFATVVMTSPLLPPLTGNVLLTDSHGDFSPQTLPVSGSLTYPTSALTAGDHTVNAAYSGDSNFVMSSGNTVEHVLSLYSPTETIVSSENSSFVGDNVTFTITVQSVYGNPTGTITLHDDLGGFPDQILPLVLVGGVPTTSYGPLSTLVSGRHTITSTYNGDSNFTSVTVTMVQLVLTPKGDILFNLPGFALFAGYSGAGDTNLPSWASFTAVPDSCPADTPVYIL